MNVPHILRGQPPECLHLEVIVLRLLGVRPRAELVCAEGAAVQPGEALAAKPMPSLGGAAPKGVAEAA